MLEQIRAISQEIARTVTVSSKDKSSAPKSDAFLRLFGEVDFSFEPSLFRSLFRTDPRQIDRKTTAQLLSSLPKEEQNEGLALIGLVNKKLELVQRVQHEVRVLTWVRAWLYVHLPVSFALLAALAIHIFSVFYYW